jgi:hypothetical protein
MLTTSQTVASKFKGQQVPAAIAGSLWLNSLNKAGMQIK